MEENGFPEYLDEEDIELARKEWLLAGFDVAFYMDPDTSHIYANVYDPEGEKSTRYLRAEGGIWLEVAGKPVSPIERPLHLCED